MGEIDENRGAPATKYSVLSAMSGLGLVCYLCHVVRRDYCMILK